MAVRVDVQERFRASAREMLALEKTYLLPISKVLVDEQGDAWSEPVQLQFSPHDDGTIDVVVRTMERER